MYYLNNYSELPYTSGIYFITNIINQKYYFGRAKNLKERLSAHYKGKDSNNHLQNAILKYGKENFEIRIIEYPSISLKELINIEQGLLDIHYGLPLCYNLSPFANGGNEAGGNSPCYGRKWYNNGIKEIFISPDGEIPEGFIKGRLPHSKETRQKISEALLGEKNPNYGRTGENHPMYGQTHSEEAKQKIGEASKGKIKINNGIKDKYISPGEEIPEGFILGGLPASKEQKQKQSMALKGEKSPYYGKIKINNGIENRLLSPGEEIPEGYVLGVLNSKKIKVITSLCCFFSVGEAKKELGIPNTKFYKLFKKDITTGFYVQN